METSTTKKSPLLLPQQKDCNGVKQQQDSQLLLLGLQLLKKSLQSNPSVSQQLTSSDESDSCESPTGSATNRKRKRKEEADSDATEREKKEKR